MSWRALLGLQDKDDTAQDGSGKPPTADALQQRLDNIADELERATLELRAVTRAAREERSR